MKFMNRVGCIRETDAEPELFVVPVGSRLWLLLGLLRISSPYILSNLFNVDHCSWKV